MNSIIYTIVMTILWLFNLFNGTGLGMAYQTTERARLIIYLVFLAIVLKKYKHHQLWVERKDIYIFGGMAVVCVAIPMIKGNGMMGLHYLTGFILTYILSKLSVSKKAIRYTGVLYAIMGLGILYIYDYSSILSGWNGNSIGMIGLYSFLFLLISFSDIKHIQNKIIILAVTLVYMYLIEPTGSRSSTWFAIIAVLLILSIIPREFVIRTEGRIYLWLLLPMIIVLMVTYVSRMSYMQRLDAWSLQEFNKPIFNGRDKLWESGLTVLKNNVLLGRGELGGNWHNCVLTALIAYGIIGGALWILSFQRILLKGKRWMKDSIVIGCIIIFLVIYVQQTVELGLICENPNYIPYIILGAMLGRIKSLKEDAEVS